MKKIKDVLLSFITKDFNWKYYTVNILFLAVFIWANYTFEFETKILKNHKRSWYIYILNYTYYFIPFSVALVNYFLTHKPTERVFSLTTDALKRIMILFFMLSIYVSFYHHRIIIENHLDVAIQYYSKITANNFISFALMFAMTFWYWKYIDAQHSSTFYGFTTKNVSFKPYLVMIILMVPLIIYASCQSDFLASYPIYNPHYAVEYLKVKEWMLVVLFETNYGLDFVATELFFRGLLVIGLSRYLHHACVVPMVMTYCVFHFGKPMGEAISSIFGGYILGILAYQTRSIYGGIVIHLAVAYMMEVGGYLGNTYFWSK